MTGRGLLRGAYLLCGLLTVTMLFCACSGATTHLDRIGASGAQAFALPLPGEIAAGLPAAKATSAAVLQLKGGAFEMDYAQRVTADGDNGLYDPDWSGGTAAFANVAYAVYRFNLAGYSGEQALTLNWPTAPADLTKVWIGFSNWGANRWDWKPGPDATGKLTLAAPGFTPYTKTGDPGSGDMLVAIVVLGSGQSALASLTISATPPPTGWTHSWGAEDGEEALGVALDGDGNVIISGYWYPLSGDTNSADCMLLKYAPDGTLLWQRKWTAPFEDVVGDVAVDSTGNIYASGYSTSFMDTPGTGAALLLLKFDANGALGWAKTYASTDVADADTEGRGIAVDGAGNVYVTGGSDGFGGDGLNHPLYLKLDAAGQLVWAKHTLDAVPAGSGAGCTLGADGNLYYSAFGGDMDSVAWLLMKCDSNGVLAWQRNFGPIYDLTAPERLVVDADGNVYAGGSIKLDGTNQEAVVVKLNTSGTLVWQSGWHAADTTSCFGLALAPDGSLFAAGRSEDSVSGNSQSMLAVLGSDGAVAAQWLATADDWNCLYDVAADAAGALYFSGTSPSATFAWATGTFTAVDPALTLTDPAGTLAEITNGELSDVTGTVETPTGVADTGGGTDDMFVQKYIPVS